MLYSPTLLIAIVAGILLMSGCAATTYDQLVPSVKIDQSNYVGKSISVQPVTSSDESSRGSMVPNLSKETFREALIESLRRSQMFETVTLAPEGVYKLSADIVSEKMTGTFDNTITVLIHYELEVNGDLTWSDNILSQGDVSVSEVFVGAERRRKLQIDAFRHNLATLLEKLSTAIGNK